MEESHPVSFSDVVVVGAGAAGLATAIFTARARPDLNVRCLDGARRVGAKILVSGGSRCNVTNREVTDRDFWGGSSRVVRNVLRAFPAEKTVELFQELGVPLHEEEDGKLFPDSNRSRTVLEALLAEAERRGVSVETGRRTTAIARDSDRFVIDAGAGEAIECRAVVLATGGRSLPKTGSDGFGYALAKRFGHGHVETTPALVPLVLEGARHVPLTGVSHPAALTLRVDGTVAIRLTGSLLWTHFGVSGPVVLNMSRHWHRARLSSGTVTLSLSACPEDTFESLEEWWIDQERLRPRAQVSTVLAARLPAAVSEAWVGAARVDAATTMAHLDRDARRRLVAALLDTPLDVRESRGYGYAEVTAGGVPLDEIDSSTLESRRCPGLYIVGEILDVDGRLGGFNFQWAWSSAWVAGQAIAKTLSRSSA